jgi:hypothetical protein
MLTRVLRELHAAGHVAIAGDAAQGFAIHLTDAGARFLQAHRAYAGATFRDALAAHFRYGAAPAWAAAWLA